MSNRRGWIDYHARMARVLAHVHEHLDAPLDLARLAALAHMSPFHRHRTYAALHGETIAATVRRLRLQRASGYLANSALPVADVALHRGPYATMRAAYAWLYGRWLVETGHAAADLPVFEEYLNDPRDTPPEALLTDTFLPLAEPAG